MDIIVDFDGTVVAHDFPKVGKDIGAQKVLKQLVKKGHRLILFTMRCDHDSSFEMKGKQPDITAKKGNYLTEAVNWFKKNDIPLYGIQTNPTQKNWTTSPKAYAPIMIDDSALGCPLKTDNSISHKPFVDWNMVETLLKLKKVL